jgi:hypothetical protein
MLLLSSVNRCRPPHKNRHTKFARNYFAGAFNTALVI